MCMVVCGININKGIVICLNIYAENNKNQIGQIHIKYNKKKLF